MAGIDFMDKTSHATWPSALFARCHNPAMPGFAVWRPDRPSSFVSACQGLLLPVVLLACLPAQAVDYTFQPGNMPDGCSGGNGVYTCTALTLGAGDKIVMATGLPTVITVTNALIAGAGSQINAQGAGNLTLKVGGLVDVGANATVTANLYAESTVTLQDRVNFTGNITTNMAVINIGANNTVIGNLTTQVGAINTGEASSVTGNLTTTGAGVITTGAGSRVTGNLTTGAGAINTGAQSSVTGNVITQVGAVTIGGNVGGKINSLGVSEAGAVTVSASGVISASITTGAGAVTLGAGSQSGGISTEDGAITVGTGSSVNGSVCSNNSGAITIGGGTTMAQVAKVAGNVISKTAGAITVGAFAQVAGAVTILKAGAKSIAAGALVGGSQNSSQCADTLVAAAIPSSRGALPPSIKSREWRQIFMR